jgi:TrmH family RNA methyltransferase
MNHDRIAVVLVGARNPLNIGAAARAMANFGFSDLRIANPYTESFRNAHSAVGAETILANAREHTTLAEAIADCTLVLGTAMPERRRPVHAICTPAEAAALLQKHLTASPDHRAALLFGSEKSGLGNRPLSHCHALLSIPTQPAQPSMNLAQAVAVCLYALATVPEAGPEGHLERLACAATATAEELDRLTQSLLELLHTTGYLRDNGVKNEAAARLIRRLHLSSGDSTLLLGMLRKALAAIQRNAQSAPGD